MCKVTGEVEAYRLLSVCTMAESARYCSFSDIENNSILSGLVYFSAKVNKGNTSSVVSLSLPVRNIRPYCFELEQEVDLEMSTSSKAEEMLENEGYIGKEHLGNIIWYANISVVIKLFCTSKTFLYRSGTSVGSNTK